MFSVPLPLEYKIKHLAMQSEIFVKEWVILTEFKYHTVLGCDYCNKSVDEISSLLDHN